MSEKHEKYLTLAQSTYTHTHTRNLQIYIFKKKKHGCTVLDYFLNGHEIFRTSVEVHQLQHSTGMGQYNSTLRKQYGQGKDTTVPVQHWISILPQDKYINNNIFLS